MTIESSVRNKVIEMHLTKKKRHEIVNALNLSGIKVSTGSISNIIKQYQQQQIPSEPNLNEMTMAPSLKILPEETFALVEIKKPEIQISQSESNETPTILTDQSAELEERIKTKQAELSQLEIEIAELHREIDEEHITLTANRKAAQDFLVVKSEMAKCGIEPDDSSHLCIVINAFRRYNYDPSKIMEAFAEVIEINDAREENKRQQQEIEEQREILARRLEEINDPYVFQTLINTLGINLDQLKSAITHLISLEQMGIGVEQIVGICRNLHQNQIRRQQWERSQGWSNDYINENNGYSQNQQGYNYGYNY